MLLGILMEAATSVLEKLTLITENFYSPLKSARALQTGSCLKAVVSKKAEFVRAFCLPGSRCSCIGCSLTVLLLAF